jgi:hypothetical protein
MMKKMTRLLLASLFALTACSTAQPVPQATSGDKGQDFQASSFEILYRLGGHSDHRLQGYWEKSTPPEEPHVTTLLEREVVANAAVHAESYNRFVSKLLSFVQHAQRAPAQEHDCRSPYSIVLKIDLKTYTSKGCRFADDGAFAKIVREGEFLLYSKK